MLGEKNKVNLYEVRSPLYRSHLGLYKCCLPDKECLVHTSLRESDSPHQAETQYTTM